MLIRETVSIQESWEALDSAVRAYQDAKQSNDQTAAVLAGATNVLNAAQKRFDETVEKVRENAPWNTDWHSKRNPGVPV